MDLHAVYLSHYGLTPSFFQKLTDTYLNATNDPFVGNVSRMKSASEPIEWVWMLTLFHIETFVISLVHFYWPILTRSDIRLFQVPAFVIGMVIMYKGKGLRGSCWT